MNPLNNKWVIWYHDNGPDWTLNGFKKLYEIQTIEDFWEIYSKLNNIIKEKLRSIIISSKIYKLKI